MAFSSIRPRIVVRDYTTAPNLLSWSWLVIEVGVVVFVDLFCATTSTLGAVRRQSAVVKSVMTYDKAGAVVSVDPS